MKFSRKARRLYERLKISQENLSSKAKPIMLWGRLSLESGMGLRKLKSTTKLLQAYGLLDQNLNVPENLKSLRLAQIQIKTGQEILKLKEQRRTDYFKAHGSMKVSDSEIARSIRLVPKPFKD